MAAATHKNLEIGIAAEASSIKARHPKVWICRAASGKGLKIGIAAEGGSTEARQSKEWISWRPGSSDGGIQLWVRGLA